jgi:hypothetical protein
VAYTRDGKCHLIYGSDMEISGLDGEWIKFTQAAVGASPEGEEGPVTVDRDYGVAGLATYLEALKERVKATIDWLAENEWDSEDDLLGPIIMDLELQGWPPFWRRTYGAYPEDPFVIEALEDLTSVEAHWRHYIREERSELLAGLSLPGDAVEMEAIYEASFLAIARPVYAAIFEALREHLPTGALVSDWGWPQKQYYQIATTDPRHDDLIRANSICIPWMSQHWDFLAPWLYPETRAVEWNQVPGTEEETEDAWSLHYGRVCEEFRRVAALCGGMPILCSVLPAFEVGESSPLLDQPLNERTASLQVQLCRQYGFSGIIMWGAMPYSSTPPTSKLQAYSTGLAFMHRHLAKYVENVDGIRVVTNSPVAIGTIG